MKFKFKKERWSFPIWGVDVPYWDYRDRCLYVLVHVGKVTYSFEWADDFD